LSEINLLTSHPYIKRNYDERAKEKTPEIVRVAKQFGKEFFDGQREYGYGGYKYDGRWKNVIKNMEKHWGFSDDVSVLDVGCAKGFFLHDFIELFPKSTVAGIDVSEYALLNSMPSVKPKLKLGSAEELPFDDNSFDLVISVNSIHNLPMEKCKQAIREVTRVSRRYSYVTLDAWKNEQQRKNLMKWILTAETYMHVDEWEKLFLELGYYGDYGWCIAE
jgi:ubiquinone/menaquinone biosynthesis C-methylase UbiE